MFTYVKAAVTKINFQYFTNVSNIICTFVNLSKITL